MVWTIHRGKRYEVKFQKLRNIEDFYYPLFGCNKPYGWQNHWVQLRRGEDENIYKTLFGMGSFDLNKYLEENFDGKYILNKLCFHKSDIKRIEEWIESLIIINKLVN